MADDKPTFLARLNAGDFGQLIGLAANFSGTVQGIAAFISLFQESDTDKILNAISGLRQDLDRDFRELGGLIQQQTKLLWIIPTETPWHWHFLAPTSPRIGSRSS